MNGIFPSWKLINKELIYFFILILTKITKLIIFSFFFLIPICNEIIIFAQLLVPRNIFHRFNLTGVNFNTENDQWFLSEITDDSGSFFKGKRADRVKIR